MRFSHAIAFAAGAVIVVGAGYAVCAFVLFPKNDPVTRAAWDEAARKLEHQTPNRARV